jgi:hypothetical protein
MMTCGYLNLETDFIFQVGPSSLLMVAHGGPRSEKSPLAMLRMGDMPLFQKEELSLGT